MNFDQMVEKDLSNCKEFGGSFILKNKDISVEIEYLCFDENTDVIFEGKAVEDFSDMEASIPSLTVQTIKTNKITNRSKIEVKNSSYGVIKKDNKKDGTTIIYLELEDV